MWEVRERMEGKTVVHPAFGEGVVVRDYSSDSCDVEFTFETDGKPVRRTCLCNNSNLTIIQNEGSSIMATKSAAVKVTEKKAVKAEEKKVAPAKAALVKAAVKPAVKTTIPAAAPVKPKAQAAKINKPIKGTAEKVAAHTSGAIAGATRRAAPITQKAATKAPIPVATKIASPVAAKPITAKTPVKKEAVKAVTADVAEVRVSPRNYILQLLLERKWTDDEIHAAVLAYYEGKPGVSAYALQKNYISMTRGDLNCGLIKKPWADGLMTAYMPRFVRNEAGELVEIPYHPSANRKAELQLPVAAQE
jgi:hypothetical protein